MVAYSIVISTFNQRETLEKILASLASQVKNPKTFEVVISDDGSTDGTDQLVKKIRFPIFMKFIQAGDNCGRAENRNRGFAKTVGKYVLFLDGDMVPGPDLVESHMTMWDSYPEDTIIGAIKNPPEWKDDSLSRYFYSRGGLSSRNETTLPGRYFVSSHFSIPRGTFERLTGFDTSFKEWGGEDTDFGLRLEKEGIRIRYHPKAVSYHYQRKTLDEILDDFRKYGGTGYRKLIEKHPDTVVFTSGWVFGLPDSRSGGLKKLISLCLSPLKSSAALSILKPLAGKGILGNFGYDWLLYGYLARGAKEE